MTFLDHSPSASIQFSKKNWQPGRTILGYFGNSWQAANKLLHFLKGDRMWVVVSYDQEKQVFLIKAEWNYKTLFHIMFKSSWLNWFLFGGDLKRWIMINKFWPMKTTNCIEHFLSPLNHNLGWPRQVIAKLRPWLGQPSMGRHFSVPDQGRSDVFSDRIVSVSSRN